MKNISINHFSELVSLLDEINVDNFYFRGESKIHDSIIASGFRPLKRENSDELDYYNLKSITKEYYKEIGHTLSSLERENFVFFCQHHGIPTNLIDITTNILTAIYFACDKPDIPGYIYCFSKLNTFEIDHTKLKYSSLIEGFVRLDDLSVETLFDAMVTLRTTNMDAFDNCLRDLIKCFYHLFDGPTCLFASQLDFPFLKNAIEDSNFNLYKTADLLSLLKKTESIFYQGDNKSPIYSKAGELGYHNDPLKEILYYFDMIPYFSILHIYLHDIFSNFSLKYNKMPLLPNFVVSSTINFDRIKSQNGIFFHQNHLERTEIDYQSFKFYCDEYKDTELTMLLNKEKMIQKIVPDITIKLTNKKHFKKIISDFGVNKQSLFPDVDTVASEIVSRNKNMVN